MNKSGSSFTIRITSEDDPPITAHLDDRPLIIGSAEDAGLMTTARYVSRYHLTVTRLDDEVEIIDQGSKNGTFLNGRKLAPQQKYIWTPGDTLMMGSARLELSAPLISSPPTISSHFDLTIENAIVRSSRATTLALHYDGAAQQHVYFEANTLSTGLDFVLDPADAFVSPGQETEITAWATPTRTFFWGAAIPVEFSAFTTDGLFASVEGHVRVRPPYHLWALILLLFIIISAPVAAVISNRPTAIEEPIAAVATATTPPEVVIADTDIPPTEAPTTEPTETSVEPTELPTQSISPTLIPTQAVTAILPTLTLVAPTATTAPVCFTQCAQLGWQSYTVQAGDTLFNLAQAVNQSVAQISSVNCIADVNTLLTGQNICLPCTDSDRDGVCDTVDNCPAISNTDQADSNNDRIGDACTPPFTVEWVTTPPSLMASGNTTCPNVPTSARGVLRVISGFGVQEIIVDLDITGLSINRLNATAIGDNNYAFDIQLSGGLAVAGDIGAHVQVTARDTQGRTGSLESTFTITNCAQPTPTATPVELAVAWAQSPPAQMAFDNFYCPTTQMSILPVVKATSAAGIASVVAKITFEGGAAAQTFDLTPQTQAGGNYAIAFDLANFAAQSTRTQAILAVVVTDKSNKQKSLAATIKLVGCSLAVNWNPAPASAVTAKNVLCPAVPKMVTGTVNISVPGVVEDTAVTASVKASGLNKSLPVTTLGNGRYQVLLDPGGQLITYTGQATIQVDVLDKRNKVYQLTSTVDLSDCALKFNWISLPDATIAGSNATCQNIPKRTSGLLSASLPSAVASTSAKIEVPSAGTSYDLIVRALGGGLYAVDIDASLLPPIAAAGNTVRFKAVDIAGDSYDLTSTIQIMDCRATTSWVQAPPAQLSLTPCQSIATLPFQVTLSVAQPQFAPPGSVTAEGRNFAVGVVGYSPVNFTSPNQFSFTVDQVPAGTQIGQTVVIRAFAPDHHDTPFIATQIVSCPGPNNVPVNPGDPQAPPLSSSVQSQGDPPTELPTAVQPVQVTEPPTMVPPTDTSVPPSPTDIPPTEVPIDQPQSQPPPEQTAETTPEVQ